MVIGSFHSDDFKILIVDDDPLIRAFLQAFCEVNNYQAEFAGNGTDALRLLGENSSYLLVIADFLMPRIHGIEFIKQVKERWRDLPVIAMSAWEDVGKSFIEAGACLFLEQPFDPYVLEREIETISSALWTATRAAHDGPLPGNNPFLPYIIVSAGSCRPYSALVPPIIRNASISFMGL